MFTFILLTLLFILIKSLHFLYLFQIKEYRLDRFYSMLKEQGLLNVFYSFHLKYPAKSLRNILIFFFVFCCCILFLLIALEDSDIYFLFSYGILLSPLIAFLLVFFGVIATKFPVYIYRQFLISKAKYKVKKSSAIWIGITGSFGKTSVKEFLYELLSTKFHTAKTVANHNTDIGIAISILKNLKKSTEVFVTEFGAYRRGEIKKASSYIPLSYVVLTGLGNQHVDLYGSRENLIAEETYLLYTLGDDGHAYIPDDLPKNSVRTNDIAAKKIFYGLHNHSTIRAILMNSEPTRQRAKIIYNHNSFIIETKLLGAHSIQNLLPAIAVAIDLGISVEIIIKKVSELVQIPGKLSLHKGKNKSFVINDGANSNTDGFIAAIHTLNSFPQKTKIIISQGIIELGVEKRQSYKRIIDELVKTDITLVTTDILFKELISKNQKDRVMTFNDVSNIQPTALPSIDHHTAILIEGKFPKSFIDSFL